MVVGVTIYVHQYHQNEPIFHIHDQKVRIAKPMLIVANKAYFPYP